MVATKRGSPPALSLFPAAVPLFSFFIFFFVALRGNLFQKPILGIFVPHDHLCVRAGMKVDWQIESLLAKPPGTVQHLLCYWHHASPAVNPKLYFTVTSKKRRSLTWGVIPQWGKRVGCCFPAESYGLRRGRLSSTSHLTVPVDGEGHGLSRKSPTV